MTSPLLVRRTPSHSQRRILLALGLGFLATNILASSLPFPSEKQFPTRLHSGMTAAEVRARLGSPNRSINESRRDDYFHYVAPLSYLNDPTEGYIGFQVHFVDGRVQDWQTLRGSPSYKIESPPYRSRWFTTYLLLVLGGAFLYGTVRAFDRGLNEYSAVKKAFAAREIPSARLPADFQFITHETTVQEVIDRLGEYSTREPRGEIVSFTYDLPYNAKVVLLPEPPFTTESSIRAVCYRPARMDDA